MNEVSGKFLSERSRWVYGIAWLFVIIAIVSGTAALAFANDSTGSFADWDLFGYPLVDALGIAFVGSIFACIVAFARHSASSRETRKLSLKRENGSFTLETTLDDEITVVARKLLWHELLIHEERIYDNRRHDDSYTIKWTLQLRVWDQKRQFVFHEAFDGIMDSYVKAVNGEPRNADYISLEPGTLSRFAKLLCTTEPEKPVEVDLLGFEKLEED